MQVHSIHDSIHIIRLLGGMVKNNTMNKNTTLDGVLFLTIWSGGLDLWPFDLISSKTAVTSNISKSVK